jgi:hypothetical protein
MKTWLLQKRPHGALPMVVALLSCVAASDARAEISYSAVYPGDPGYANPAQVTEPSITQPGAQLEAPVVTPPPSATAAPLPRPDLSQHSVFSSAPQTSGVVTQNGPYVPKGYKDIYTPLPHTAEENAIVSPVVQQRSQLPPVFLPPGQGPHYQTIADHSYPSAAPAQASASASQQAYPVGSPPLSNLQHDNSYQAPVPTVVPPEEAPHKPSHYNQVLNPVDTDLAQPKEWSNVMEVLETENIALRDKLRLKDTDKLSDIRVDAVSHIREQALRNRISDLEKQIDTLQTKSDADVTVDKAMIGEKPGVDGKPVLDGKSVLDNKPVLSNTPVLPTKDSSKP